MCFHEKKKMACMIPSLYKEAYFFTPPPPPYPPSRFFPQLDFSRPGTGSIPGRAHLNVFLAPFFLSFHSLLRSFLSFPPSFSLPFYLLPLISSSFPCLSFFPFFCVFLLLIFLHFSLPFFLSFISLPLSSLFSSPFSSSLFYYDIACDKVVAISNR